MIAMKSIREGFVASGPNEPIHEVPRMKYSATLDFGTVFGFSQSCPSCGSSAIRTFPELDEFRCDGCGSQWGPPRSASEHSDDKLPR